MALVLDTARFKYPVFWAPVDKVCLQAVSIRCAALPCLARAFRELRRWRARAHGRSLELVAELVIYSTSSAPK